MIDILSKITEKPNFDNDTVNNVILLFLAVMQDKIIDLNNKEGLETQTILDMSAKFGNELMHLIHVYTGINVYYNASTTE